MIGARPRFRLEYAVPVEMRLDGKLRRFTSSDYLRLGAIVNAEREKPWLVVAPGKRIEWGEDGYPRMEDVE